MASAVQTLKSRLYDLNALNSAMAVMGWDQQCYMPAGGAPARAEHLGILSRMSHEMLVSDETRKALDAARAEAEPGSVDAALVRLVQRSLDLRTKIPTALVEEKTRLEAHGHEVWVEARKTNDFSKFEPILRRMVEIVREEASALGYQDHPYDALIDQYEEGQTAAQVRAMFETLKAPLTQLVRDLVERGEKVDDGFLYGQWDETTQRRFTEEVVRAIGFDLERGRQDTAPHPFCTNFSVGDVRLTTRFRPYLGSAIFGSLHEAGHGMYEQGSPMEWDRLPVAGGVSLGVHESQSRLWENIVGRSSAFWSHFLPKLSAAFPALEGVGVDRFVKAVNKVQPSLIRVEADEVTYNLHILVRFELECDLVTGALDVRDLPEAWNGKYEAYLGIRPDSDASGCLQDVHWSGGMIGYFPTYTMGNLLSYQIWKVLSADLGDPEAMIARGEFAPILGWLREKIYAKGSRFTPTELVQQVTGKPMGAEDYLAGISKKYRGLYGI